MSRQTVVLALMILILTACGSTPERKAEIRETPVKVEDRGAAPAGGGYLVGDGPGKDIPANLNNVPDAIPRVEPLHPYANRPYVAMEQSYTPYASIEKYPGERGIASWYGKKFHGLPTSSGETYDMYAMTAAHPTLPIPSYARVTNTANNKSVVVRINDRGPFLHDRVIDLSYTAAYRLGIIDNGSSEVKIEGILADSGAGTIAVASKVESRPLEKTEMIAAPAAAAASFSPFKSVPSGGNVYLQLGAFKTQKAADSFLEKMRAVLGDTSKQLGVIFKDGLTRVHLGPYASTSDARSSAGSLKGKLGFMPIVKLH